MDNDNKNQNDQHNEGLESDDEKQSEYREISQDELKQILEDHGIWLESEGKEGKQADLSRANLQAVNLVEANLQGANLDKANLHQANCIEANLKKTLLYEVNLQGANLYKANLVEANLQGANLDKANLVEANLQGANLDKANLNQANCIEANLNKAMLYGANIQKTNLNSANLQESILYGANLQNANLHGADLQKSVLQNVIGLDKACVVNANFENAIGLIGNEFAQSDVTGTKLPKYISDFESLKIVEETSKVARGVFIIMLLACVYSWLTIFSTNDPDLLTNTLFSPPPVSGAKIPLASFYIYIPIFLFGFFIYFNFYLIRLWKSLKWLPAIFPDGKRLDERAYPWLLNGIVRRHFELLKQRELIIHLEEWLLIFLVWIVVPLTMIGFWLRYLPRHDSVGTFWHIVLISISLLFSIFFYHSCAIILSNDQNYSSHVKNQGIKKITRYGIFLLSIIFGLSILSYSVINGEKSIGKNLSNIETVVPALFLKIGYSTFADFNEKVVSFRPDDYFRIPIEERIDSVLGAKLKEMNLSFADMNNSFLVKSDFRYSLLNNASLINSNLQNANFGGSNLKKANLSHGNLKGAIFIDANLQQANLEKTNLKFANFTGAILKEVNFWDANLQQTTLTSANIKGASLRLVDAMYADFYMANLQEANLGRSNLQRAIFVSSDLQRANLWLAKLQLTTIINANLKKANLAGANLQQATIVNTNFQEANLTGANLQQTDLTGAIHLTAEQLSKVKTLYKAKLDPDLMEKVKKCCSHLLEEPKEKIDKIDK